MLIDVDYIQSDFNFASETVPRQGDFIEDPYNHQLVEVVKVIFVPSYNLDKGVTHVRITAKLAD